MADRQWSTLNCLCYLFNAFAVYTDGDLDDEEKNEIRNIVGEWAPDMSRNDVHASLDLCLGYFKEDMELDNADSDARVVANTCINIATVLKENMSLENCKAIHNDLVRIGEADGNYDENEKNWATLIGETLGVNTE